MRVKFQTKRFKKSILYCLLYISFYNGITTRFLTIFTTPSVQKNFPNYAVNLSSSIFSSAVPLNNFILNLQANNEFRLPLRIFYVKHIGLQ